MIFSRVSLFGMTVIALLLFGLAVAWQLGHSSSQYMNVGWQYRWVDSAKNPADGMDGSGNSEEWRTLAFPANMKDWDGRSVLLLRGALPEPLGENPLLYLVLVSQHVECWLEGSRIYQGGEILVPDGVRYNPLFPSHLILLPGNAAGKEVILRIHSPGPRIGLAIPPRIGSLSEFLQSRAQLDFIKVSSAALCFFGALIAAIIALRTRKEQIYWAFAGTALCNGLIVLGGAFTFQLLLPSAQAKLLLLMLGAIFWQAFWLWFLESVVESRYAAIVRRVRNFVFVLGSAEWLLLLADWVTVVFLFQAILGLLFCNVLLLFYVFRGQLRSNEEARIYAIGAAAWVIASTVDGLRALGLIQIPLTPSVLGQFVDLSCMAYILIQRVRKVYQQKEQAGLQILANYAEMKYLNEKIRLSNEELEKKIWDRTQTLQQQNDQMESLKRSRQNLLSNIAHDLRTPITLIRGYVEAILDGIAQSSEQRQKAVRVVYKKTLLLQHLIDDLFTLCKLESRTMAMSLQYVSVKAFLQSILSSYDVDAAKAGLQLNLETFSPMREVHIRIDKFRMEQVFANLIYNAIKFTPSGGCITLAAKISESGDEVILSVKDTGVGIDAANLDKIFDRYYSSDSLLVHADKVSTGLGLAIAKELVELHQGKIWVENGATGGSEFYVALPITELNSL